VVRRRDARLSRNLRTNVESGGLKEVSVRKGTTYALVVCVAAAGAFVAVRGCSEKPVPTAKTSGKNAKSRPSASAAPAEAPPPAMDLSPAKGPDAPDASAEGRVVFFSPWGGSQKDQLGHERPQEGNPMGPMSVAHDASGKIYVLDQVNGRVVRRGPDGAVDRVSDMKLKAAQDLAVTADGSMAVLDRHGDKAIALYDAAGALKGQLPLAGDGIEETGLVTGLFVDGSDVYVEREHGPLVKIGDVNGTPATPRVEIPGRPSNDGKLFLNAGITDGPAGRTWVSAIDRQTNDHRFTREIRFKSEVVAIVLLDSDKKGTIYFAVAVHEEPSNDYVQLQCLEATKGTPMGGAILPPNQLPEETFRDLTVLDDGGVVYAIRTEEGVTYKRYECGG
jgi:hypothetical protein